jgi:type II secretory pathway component PulF
MEAATLDDFMAWNDELYALAQAGVPIDVDLGRGGMDAVGALEKINAAVARRVSQGATLAEAVQSNDQVVTPAYGSLVQFGLRSGNLAAALVGSNRLAESLDDLGHAVRQSILYPLVVCGLAYAGLVAFCLFFVPTLDDLHREMRLQPGAGLRVLQTLRETLPYWVAIPPAALALLAGWQMVSGSQHGLSRGLAARLLRWLPGMSRAIHEQRCANFAETLATLLDAGAPLDEALRLAAGALGEASQADDVQALAASASAGTAIAEDSQAVLRLPPFLRYALWRADAGIGRERALRMAAGLYRDSSRRRAERVRIIAPLVLCVVFGGGATLLYGLALFVPVVEMLRSLAQ